MAQEAAQSLSFVQILGLFTLIYFKYKITIVEK